MLNLTPVIGALLATYFVSRATLLIPYPLERTMGLIVAHALSFLLIGAVLIGLRQPLYLFAPTQMLVYIIPQLAWLALDFVRRNWPRTRRQ
jgi:hypothetical protein